MKRRAGRKPQKRITREEQIRNLERPLRQREATLATIAARNEKLRAFKAMDLRSNITRLETELKRHPNPLLEYAIEQLRKELSNLLKNST